MCLDLTNIWIGESLNRYLISMAFRNYLETSKKFNLRAKFHYFMRRFHNAFFKKFLNSDFIYNEDFLFEYLSVDKSNKKLIRCDPEAHFTASERIFFQSYLIKNKVVWNFLDIYFYDFEYRKKIHADFSSQTLKSDS